MYSPPAKTITKVNPVNAAIVTDMETLITEALPLAHQAHGINDFSLLPKIRIPKGKGIPIIKPKGRIINIVSNILKLSGFFMTNSMIS